MKNIIYIAAMTSFVAAAANADVVTFNDLSHGDMVAEQYAVQGLHISAVNYFQSFDIAMAFDSTLSGTADPDLEDAWNSGNIPSSTDLGNLLIIQENNWGNPDDQAGGGQPVGQLIFNFDMTLASFGFHVVDLESESAEQSSVDFYLNGGLVESIDFEEFLAGGTHDNGVIYGNNSANLINEFAVAGGFDQAIINVGGSMAFDNISYTVPAPGAFALLGLGATLSIRRRR